MIKSKYWQYLLVGCFALTLVACSKKHPGQGGVEDLNGGVGGAQVYSMNDQGQYGDQGGNGSVAGAGRHVNALTAPSNQVYYFSYDQDSVEQSDMQAITIQANYLASHPNAHVRLEGNTDNRGSREYNIALGWRRAQAVARVLEQQGVSPNQIAEVSYGKERPAVNGDSEEAWSLNRRVELIYEAQ